MVIGGGLFFCFGLLLDVLLDKREGNFYINWCFFGIVFERSNEVL